MHFHRRIALALVTALALVPAAQAEGFQGASGGVYSFSDSSVAAQQPAAQSGVEIPTATLSPQVAALPWNLMLVNRNNPVPGDWSPELVMLDNGRQVDSRILPDLQRMFDDCRKAGLNPTVYTAYRSYEDQKDMLVSKYRQYKNQGMSRTNAQIAALKVANYPGYSEHQLGLAVDIDSADPTTCSNASVWDWVKHHCHEYGFIWRYPKQKSDITGIDNEDWHFRYVGVEAATYMMTNYLCLEEYLQQFYGIPY